MAARASALSLRWSSARIRRKAKATNLIVQLRPTLWLSTPKGIGLAHFMIDYGEEHDLLWVVFDDATGEIWTWSNDKVRAIKNISLDAERGA